MNFAGLIKLAGNNRAVDVGGVGHGGIGRYDDTAHLININITGICTKVKDNISTGLNEIYIVDVPEVNAVCAVGHYVDNNPYAAVLLKKPLNKGVAAGKVIRMNIDNYRLAR